MTKMTNVMALNYVLTNCEIPTEVAEKLTKMAEQCAKKSSTLRKPTANQVENESFKTAIVEALSNGEQMTISEMVKGIEMLNEVSNQRVSAIVKQMVEANILRREEVKRKAYFSLA